MGDDGNSGGWDGLGGITGSIDTSGMSLGSPTGQFSGEFGDAANGFNGFGIDSLDPGLMDIAQYNYEPSLINDYAPLNMESPMTMQDLPDMEDNSFMGQLGKLAKGYVAFSKTLPGQVVNFGLTKANPALGIMSSLARAGYAASQSPSQAGKALGGFAGSVGLGSMFGPPGSVAGSIVGGKIGEGMLGGLSRGYSGPAMGNQPGQEGGGIGLGTGGLLGLAALYQGSRNAREIGGQMSSLQSLYGANSPFAQQAMQAIQRKGAAGGRRTSGNRADAAGLTQNQVQLQSLLAQNAARLAPTLAQMQQSLQGNRGQTLANLAGLYQKMGGWDGIQSGLDGLYSSVNGALNGFEAYDPSGYGIGSGTENYSDVLPDVWG